MNENSTRFASARVQRRNEERRLGILRAASRVFRRRGFIAAGMREIAEEAGISPGNLYHYFKGKDAILYFCQDRTLVRMQAALDAAPAAGGTVADQVAAVIRAHVQCMLDEFEGATAHLELDALPEALRLPLVERRDRYERSLRALIAGGVASGELPPCDAALVTRAMLGAINWSARWYRSDGPQTVDDVAAGLADYLVRGLVAPARITATPARVAHSGGRS
ncbi:MAG: TetR family transcriptional regulator [Gammaproteobacteria bacterium]|nr:TetR family transcriptional regulator [Gammaproteobacteria bacterium]